MTFPQYKRLVFVMLVPLLLLGAWLANSEKLMDQHYKVECRPNTSSYSCSLLMMDSLQSFNYSVDEGGVWLDEEIRLRDGFSETVVGLQNEKDSSERSIRVQIPHDWKPDLYDQGPVHCRMAKARTIDGKDAWTLFGCGPHSVYAFRFANPESEKRYLDAFEHGWQKVHEGKIQKSNGYLASFFTPLLVFIAISIIGWIVVRAARYVRGPIST